MSNLQPKCFAVKFVFQYAFNVLSSTPGGYSAGRHKKITEFLFNYSRFFAAYFLIFIIGFIHVIIHLMAFEHPNSSLGFFEECVLWLNVFHYIFFLNLNEIFLGVIMGNLIFSELQFKFI